MVTRGPNCPYRGLIGGWEKEIRRKKCGVFISIGAVPYACGSSGRNQKRFGLWLPLKQSFYACGSSGRNQKRFGLWLPLKQAFYACMALAMPSAIWSMAPCSLPPTIIFIIMFSSMCRTSRMRVSVSETLCS